MNFNTLPPPHTLPITTPHTLSPTACLGYALMSADNIGMDRKTITELIRAMQVNLDRTTVEDAEDYCRWEHED